MSSLFVTTMLIYSILTANSIDRLSQDASIYVAQFLSLQEQIELFRWTNRHCNDCFEKMHEIDKVRQLEFIIRHKLNDDSISQFKHQIADLIQHLKFNELYYWKLPILLNIMHSQLNDHSFKTMMDITNTHSMGINEFESKLRILSHEASLLVFLSRNLLHYFLPTQLLNCDGVNGDSGFRTLFVNDKPLFTKAVLNEYPWLTVVNETYLQMAESVLYFTYLLEHIWDHYTSLSLDSIYTSPSKQDQVALMHLINNHGLILWNRNMIKSIRAKHLRTHSMAYSIYDLYVEFNDLCEMLFDEYNMSKRHEIEFHTKWVLEMIKNPNVVRISFDYDVSEEFVQFIQGLARDNWFYGYIQQFKDLILLGWQISHWNSGYLLHVFHEYQNDESYITEVVGLLYRIPGIYWRTNDALWSLLRDMYNHPIQAKLNNESLLLQELIKMVSDPKILFNHNHPINITKI